VKETHGGECIDCFTFYDCDVYLAVDFAMNGWPKQQ